MKFCRCIAVLLTMFWPLLVSACPVDDPSTAYNESEAPISVATPASVNTEAQVVADGALGVQPVALLQVINTDDERVSIAAPIVADLQSRLELLCTMLC